MLNLLKRCEILLNLTSILCCQLECTIITKLLLSLSVDKPIYKKYGQHHVSLSRLYFIYWLAFNNKTLRFSHFPILVAWCMNIASFPLHPSNAPSFFVRYPKVQLKHRKSYHIISRMHFSDGVLIRTKSSTEIENEIWAWLFNNKIALSTVVSISTI